MLSVILVTGIVLLDAVLNLQGQKATGQLLREALSKNVSAMHLASGIKHDFVFYDDLTFRFLSTGDEALLDEGDRVRKKVTIRMERLEQESDSRTVKELLSELETESAIYFEEAGRLLAAASGSAAPGKKESILRVIRWAEQIPVRQKSMGLLSARGKEKLALLYALCDKLVDLNRVHMEDVQKQIGSTLEQSEKTILWGGSSVFLGIALIEILLAFSILSPLRELQSGIHKIMGGELNVEINPRSNDEIGQITRAFNQMTRNLREKQEQLLKETITDALTGLFNFRYFEEGLKAETERARRYNRPLSVMLIDIDHFKAYNDNHGHEMGNVILKMTAHALRETLRISDVLARYGGEEFVVFLPDTDKTNAQRVAERVRQAIDACQFPGQESQPLGKLTISAGLACFPEDAKLAKDLVGKADKALYKAKHLGRNRVELV